MGDGEPLCRSPGAILVLDEVQKAIGWSESVKRLWDEDTRAKRPIKVVLLGSAPLLVQRGLSESLAGRFEIVRLPHWSLVEMRAAFDFSVDQYLYFGGYPGAAPLVSEPERWRRYILDALIETTIARDVLLLSRVDKPALLRRLFELGCRYSGQVLSYNKMLGQLHDAGNTTTLAHYLELLGGCRLAHRTFQNRRVERCAAGVQPEVPSLEYGLDLRPGGVPSSKRRLPTATIGGASPKLRWAPTWPMQRLRANAKCFTGASATVKLISWCASGRTLTAIEVKSNRSRDTDQRPRGLCRSHSNRRDSYLWVETAFESKNFF